MVHCHVNNGVQCNSITLPSSLQVGLVNSSGRASAFTADNIYILHFSVKCQGSKVFSSEWCGGKG